MNPRRARPIFKRNHPTAASVAAPRSPPLPFRQAVGFLPSLRGIPIGCDGSRCFLHRFNARPVAGCEYHCAFCLSSPCGELPCCQSYWCDRSGLCGHRCAPAFVARRVSYVSRQQKERIGWFRYEVFKEPEGSEIYPLT